MPNAASNIKFFDEIGNSSKTTIFHSTDQKSVILKFYLRYPLLGGWKASYVLQYDVPVYDYLLTTRHSSISQQNNYYKLTLDLGDYVLNEKLTEQASFRIVLPETSIVMNVKAPKECGFSHEEISLTGLYLFGKPTIVLSCNWLLDNRSYFVVVEYLFSKSRLLQAPLIITFYLMFVFVVVIICRRYYCLINL